MLLSILRPFLSWFKTIPADAVFEVMRNVDEVQAACSDILADARKINAEREAEEEAAFIADSAEDQAEA